MKFGKEIRLLNIETFQFEEFTEKELEINPYAILSHVWYKAEKEIVFHGFTQPDLGKLPPPPKDPEFLPSYNKIINTCFEARKTGSVEKGGREMKLRHVWIDSICIDKRKDSNEEDRSIRSMWRWYQKAARCIVYLSDVKSAPDDHPSVEEQFKKANWWNRGWTLQELLASEIVDFFSQTWKFLGNKEHFSSEIAERGRIEKMFLVPDNVKTAPVAKRMSWAVGRKTAYEVDRVYSLFGIFGVNMSPAYGETYEEAFARLQTKILTDAFDESLFVWRDSSLQRSGLLAPTIECFKDSNDVGHYCQGNGTTRSVQILNAGLKFQVPNWKFGQGKPDDLAFWYRRRSIKRSGIELDLYCSKPDPESGKMRAVAVKLAHDDHRDGWRRTDCGNLLYPPKVRYGFWLGQAATGQFHGLAPVTIFSGYESEAEEPDDEG